MSPDAFRTASSIVHDAIEQYRTNMTPINAEALRTSVSVLRAWRRRWWIAQVLSIISMLGPPWLLLDLLNTAGASELIWQIAASVVFVGVTWWGVRTLELVHRAFQSLLRVAPSEIEEANGMLRYLSYAPIETSVQ